MNPGVSIIVVLAFVAGLFTVWILFRGLGILTLISLLLLALPSRSEAAHWLELTNATRMHHAGLCSVTVGSPCRGNLTYAENYDTCPVGGNQLIECDSGCDDSTWTFSGGPDWLPVGGYSGFDDGQITCFTDYVAPATNSASTTPVPVTLTDINSPDVLPSYEMGCEFGLLVCGTGWILRMAKRTGNGYD